MSSELARRVAVAAAGIPVVLACLALGGWVLGALVALAAVLGSAEFYDLSRARGERPFTVLGAAASGTLVLLAVDPGPAFLPMVATLVLGLTLVLLGASVWLRWPGGDPAPAVGSTLTGVLYVGGSLAFVPLLRGVPEALRPGLVDPWVGSVMVLLPLLSVWAGDSAAYFVGRALGRTRLAPHASPGKTVEGGIAGLLGSTLAGLLVGGWGLDGLLTLDPAMGGALLGAAAGAVGQVGDLAESVLKRGAGVKDSGRLLPGHGGMLDRLDALLFAFPATWAVLAMLGATP